MEEREDPAPEQLLDEDNRNTGSRTRAAKLAAAARLFDRMRNDPGCTAFLASGQIGAVQDCRRSAAMLPQEMGADLERLLDRQSARTNPAGSLDRGAHGRGSARSGRRRGAAVRSDRSAARR